MDWNTANEGSEQLYDDAVQAERQHDYEKAIRLFALAADLKVPCAAYSVCRLIEKSGERVENPELYEFWLRTAAQTDSIASYTYANYLLRNGQDIAYKKYLRYAAELGHEDSLTKLVRYYLSQDNKAAAKFYLDKKQNSLVKKLLGIRLKNVVGIEPMPFEMPDESVELYSVGVYAQELGLPHIAFDYFKKAADCYYIPALEKIVDCAYNGNGTNPDPKLVIWALEELGASGKTDAYIQLGDYYRSGELTDEPNSTLAFAEYEKAAKARNLNGIFLVGAAYEKGFGVAQSFKKAITWYEMGAQLGSVECANETKKLKELSEHYFQEGILEQKQGLLENAFLSYKQASVYGHLDAICSLGDCYLGGIGCKKDMKRALECYDLGAQNKHAKSLYRLGTLYEQNYGVRFSYKIAKNCYLAALQFGMESARNSLQKLEQKKNKHIAARFYKIACVIYHKGMHQEATKFLTVAAKMNNPKAAYLLGCMYDCGDGVTKNLAKASVLYLQAEKLGFNGKTNGYYRSYLKRLPR